MKVVAITIFASLLGTAAFAQDTTVIHREGPVSDSTTVIRRDGDGDVVRRSETTGPAGGCDTKSVTRTNDDGDSKTKTVTRC